MIKTDFKDYCQDCPAIKVVHATGLNDYGDVMTTIRCERSDTCARIERRIREHVQEDVNKYLKAKGIEV